MSVVGLGLGSVSEDRAGPVFPVPRMPRKLQNQQALYIPIAPWSYLGSARSSDLFGTNTAWPHTHLPLLGHRRRKPPNAVHAL